MLIYILFVLGFVLVIKGADFLTDGASAVAEKLKVSDLAIGLTIVSFGTSLPEFMVNIIASRQGNSGIAIGNILGSNIANILLILGISAIISPIIIRRKTVWVEIPLSLMAALMLGVLGMGNVVGSNIFNIFWVLGWSSIIRPVPFQKGTNSDLGFTILVSLLLFVTMFIGKRKILHRWEGTLFLLLYCSYMTFAFIKG